IRRARVAESTRWPPPRNPRNAARCRSESAGVIGGPSLFHTNWGGRSMTHAPFTLALFASMLSAVLASMRTTGPVTVLPFVPGVHAQLAATTSCRRGAVSRIHIGPRGHVPPKFHCSRRASSPYSLNLASAQCLPARAGAGVDGDAASEPVAHHALHHRQSHPAPIPELLGGEPRLEDALQVSGTDSGTLVAHGEPQRPTGLLQADADWGRPADARVGGVTDQVHEHVVQGVRVALEIDLLERKVELERDSLVLQDTALERAAGADHPYGAEPLRARQRIPV